MGFTTLSDDYYERAEFAGVGPMARLLDTEALVWSNRIRTDGHVPKKMVKQIGWQHPDLDADIAELVESGAWIDTGDAYQLDWTYQETKEQHVERQKKKEEEKKGAAFRAERSRQHRAGNHSLCDPNSDYCKPLGRGVMYEPRYLATLSDEQRAALPREGAAHVMRDVRAGAGLPIPTPSPSPTPKASRRRVKVEEADGAARAPASAKAPASGGRTVGRKNPRGGPRGFHRCAGQKANGDPCLTAVKSEGQLCPRHRPGGENEVTNRNTSAHAAASAPAAPPSGTNSPAQAKAHPHLGEPHECLSCGRPVGVPLHSRLPDGGWGSEYLAHVTGGGDPYDFTTEVGAR